MPDEQFNWTDRTRLVRRAHKHLAFHGHRDATLRYGAAPFYPVGQGRLLPMLIILRTAAVLPVASQVKNRSEQQYKGYRDVESVKVRTNRPPMLTKL